MHHAITMEYHRAYRSVVNLERDYKGKFEIQKRAISDLSATIKKLEAKIKRLEEDRNENCT